MTTTERTMIPYAATGVQMDGPDQKDRQHELTIHEFDALRGEIESNVSEMRRIEVYAVLATALLYAFLINLEKGTKDEPPFQAPIWAWAIPIVFPVLATIRGKAFNAQVRHIADYIRAVEERYARTPLGWEHHMTAVRAQGRTTLGRSSQKFALVLGLFSVGVFMWRLITRYKLFG